MQELWKNLLTIGIAMKIFNFNLGLELVSNSNSASESHLLTKNKQKSNYPQIMLKLADSISPVHSFQKHMDAFDKIVQSLEIDVSQPGKVLANIQLTGEQSEIKFEALTLIKTTPEDCRLRFIELKVSNPWMEVLINEIILDLIDETKNKEIRLPSFLQTIFP